MGFRTQKYLYLVSMLLWPVFCGANLPQSETQQGPSKGGTSRQSEIVRSLGAMPMAFEENKGQSAPQVRYLVRGNGYALFLCPTEAVMKLRRSGPENSDVRHPQKFGVKGQEKPDEVVHMRLVGANPLSKAVGCGRLQGKSNYFKGNDPSRWVKNAILYGKVRFQDVYPGIDVVYYGNGGRLEYDFVVKPGADPKAIRLRFEGAENLTLDGQGNVKAKTGCGEVVLKAPVLYEKVWFDRKPVEGRFALAGKNEVRFEVGDYDRTRALVLDPVLDYSTYLGGSNEDSGNGIAVDASGNVYVTGYTSSTNFPTQNPYQPANSGFKDAFVAKINAAGTALVYSTYFGGNGNDAGNGIAVDGSGNAYVVGYTNSVDFPTQNPIQGLNAGSADAFIVKLNAAGTALVYSTYLGGNYSDYGTGIAVDGSGNAYVVGYTGSTNFPTVSPVQASNAGGNDIFVAKLNATGAALIYSTYLGGSGYEVGNAIVVDASGNAYVTGYTGSADFPMQNPIQPVFGGVQDAFVTKINAAGTAWVYSTFLGGNDFDTGNGIAVDGTGAAYVVGTTQSNNFPTQNPFQSSNGGGWLDSFVTKLNASGTALVYSTYFGGSGAEYGYGIAVDGSGNAYVTGDTLSSDFPMQNPIQALQAGSSDVFVAEFNSTGTALIYSTYFGGSGYDVGNGIAVDGSGNAYVVGYTNSVDFPALNPIQSTYGGGTWDVFVFKLANVSQTTPTSTPSFTTTATGTPTPTTTLSFTATQTPSSTWSSTFTPTATLTVTSTNTLSPTPTFTQTPTATPTPTLTPLPTAVPGCFYVSRNAMRSTNGDRVDIMFCSTQNGRAILKIYNSAGELMRELFNNFISPGSQYQSTWDGKNKSGEPVASGVYLIHLTLPDSTRLAKVVVIR